MFCPLIAKEQEQQEKKKSTSDSLSSIPKHKFSIKVSTANINTTQKFKTTPYTTPKTIIQPKVISSTVTSSSLKSSIKNRKNSTTIKYSTGKGSNDNITYINSVSSLQPVTLVKTLGTNKKSTNNNNSEQEMVQQNLKQETLNITTNNADSIMSTSQKIITAATTTIIPAIPVASEISTNMMITSTVVNTENVNPTLGSTTLKVGYDDDDDSSRSNNDENSGTSATPRMKKPFSRPRVLTRLQEKINSLECDIQNLPQDAHLWRGNETHELLLPITVSV